MKKVISFLLLSVMMLTMIAPGMAVACDHTNREWVVKRAATCTITGWEWLTCKDCGQALAERYTPKKDHTRKTVTVRPACASASGGLERVVCGECGTELVATYPTPRRTHTWRVANKKQIGNGVYQFTWRCGGCGRTTVTKGRNPVAPSPTLGQ